MEKIHINSDLLKNSGDIRGWHEKYFGNPTGKILLTVSPFESSYAQLETIAAYFTNNNQKEALNHFEVFKDYHLSILNELIPENSTPAKAILSDLFTEVEWLLYDKPVRDRDYYYAQILCCGELVSSALLSAYLLEKKSDVKWVDARDFIKTDSVFTAASIITTTTKQQIDQVLIPVVNEYMIIITQYSIGSTMDNENTILNNSTENHLFHLV